jgi:hypothetical protein
VFDLAFTIDARGTTTPLMLPIDQAVSPDGPGAIRSRATSTSPNSKRSALPGLRPRRSIIASPPGG